MYDAGFKRMFSHPRMTELVIRRHIPEWAGRLDFSTLEKWPTEQIGDKLVKRYADLAWRCVAKDEESDHLLLMEFQGRPERRMALRIAAYAALAAKEFLDQRGARGDPPRALELRSLVLHHGDRPWSAPTRAAELLAGSRLDAYRVVSRRPPGAPEPELPDLPETALGLGGEWTVDGMRLKLTRIRRLVRECGDDDFDWRMARAVAAMLVSRGVPKRVLEEAMTMEAVVSAFEREWNDLVRKGREQGIRRGQAQMLRRQVAHRFGLAVEEELSGMLAVPVGSDRMRLLAEAVLECDSGGDFLSRAREVLPDS